MYWFRGLHLVISPIFTANFYGQILHVFLLNLLWYPQGSLGYQQIAQSGRETTRRHVKAKKRRWKSKYQYFHALFWHLQNIYNLIREFENKFGFDLRLWLLIKGVNNVRSRGIWKKKTVWTWLASTLSPSVTWQIRGKLLRGPFHKYQGKEPKNLNGNS